MPWRLALPIALSVVALLGASSAQGMPAAGPGYVASFQISYDSPPFPDARYRVTASFTADVCGDPFDDTWGFEATRTGGPSTPPPTLTPVTFAVENPDHCDRGPLVRCERGRDRPDRFRTALQRGRDTDAHAFVANDGRHRERRRDADGIAGHCADDRRVPRGAAATTASRGQRGFGHGVGHRARQRQAVHVRSAIPYGSRVNVTDGRLILKTELGTVTVYGNGVPAVFRLVRLREPRDMVGMRLVEGRFNTCGKNKAARPVRRLWAKGSGKFQTMGRYATATVRGGWWLTADLCDQTLVRARQGSVLVNDFVTKKKVVVKAPKSYTARRKAR